MVPSADQPAEPRTDSVDPSDQAGPASPRVASDAVSAGRLPDGKLFHDYASFLRRRYGGRVYRVPIDLGLGCPHRDPLTLGGGCTYCATAGSRAVHLRRAMPLEEQVRLGVAFGRRRYRADQFAAYFQASTSTYAPPDELRRLFSVVLGQAAFCGIVVSTRPDCLPDDVLDLLAELSTTHDVWVELGVQTSNDGTLQRINRGHDFASSVHAAHALAARGLYVAAHVILGLPGEGVADFHGTAAALRQLPVSGIKIHNLHVVKGTALAAEWAHGAVSVWDEHAYGEVLMDFLRRLPAAWPVMRFVSDTPRDVLLAPKWWMSKGEFSTYVQRQMAERSWRQGDLAGDPSS